MLAASAKSQRHLNPGQRRCASSHPTYKPNNQPTISPLTSSPVVKSSPIVNSSPCRRLFFRAFFHTSKYWQAYHGLGHPQPANKEQDNPHSLVRSWQDHITIRMPRSKEPHPCRYCNEVLADKFKRNRHETLRHMKCTTCFDTFSSTEALQKHLGDLGRCPREFRCLVTCGRVCNKRFFSQEALDAHELGAHPGKHETCSTCGRKFRNLSCHLGWGGGECGTKKLREAMKCDSCKHEFSAVAALKKHKKKGCKGTISWQATQVHGFQLPCPFANKGCNGRRRDEVDMALHIEKEHNAPTTWFRCRVPNCSSALSGKPYKARGIRAHMDNHERHGHARYTLADYLAPIKTSAPQNHHSDEPLSTDEVLAILDEMDKAEESLDVQA
jgi:hypothetical protein